MADEQTTNRLFSKIEVGASDNTWGTKNNANWQRVDDLLGDTTAKTTTGGDTTLTDDEQDVAIIEISGTLASNATITFDGRRGFWIVKNGTSGAFSVTFLVSGQTGITVAQGNYALIYCNGTDIVEALETTDISTLVERAGWESDAEVAVVSAATCNVLGAASLFVDVTGSTGPITSFGTGTNRLRIVRFASTPTITHNGTSLIIPGAANVTVAAGDVWILKSDASSNVRVVSILKAAGLAYVAGGTDVAVADGGTGAGTAGDARTNLSAAARAQTSSWHGVILGALSNRSYTLVLKADHAGTITETTTKCVSGTATATFKIGSTALGGTANSVSSSEQSQAQASNNAYSAGDDIVLTISSNSSCVDLSFTIKRTVTLA